MLGSWQLESGIKLPILGDTVNRLCRFCGKRPPEVTFRKIAHAIPQSLGNDSLFSAYECDDCNEKFGKSIENDFGKWSMPMRTFARISGKKGIPTLKNESAGWRIEYEGEKNGFMVNHREGDPVFCVNEKEKTVTIQVEREPYTPIAVLKAFVKMGLSVIPEIEMPNFSEAVEWIGQAGHQDSFISELSVIYTIAPGSLPNDKITILMLRRRPEYIGVPYAYFVLIYGNEMFQVMLPSRERDKALDSKLLSLNPFPHPTVRFGAPRYRLLDLTSREIVRGEVTALTMAYSDRVEVDAKK
ncbi:HNH endonuclease [Paraburkholderia aspalathi]|uniref:HNH endonuclease n=1 Tax=Paraburkholderia aspalathi TaxID=1324617 RepID=UPI0038BA3E0F